MIEARTPIESNEAESPKAASTLLALTYQELRRLAAIRLARQPPGQTLQPTELVHEVWLRLVGANYAEFANRAQFFSMAAEAMRCILVDRARRRMARRHGGNCEHVPLSDCEIASPESDERLLAVHEVLDRFKALYPAQAEVVKLRYLIGMTNDETAEIVGMSVATVKNYWVFARTWILREIDDRPEGADIINEQEIQGDCRLMKTESA
jgi:RNA polymerase sigma factor (TIGR02999 family)